MFGLFWTRLFVQDLYVLFKIGEQYPPNRGECRQSTTFNKRDLSTTLDGNLQLQHPVAAS